MGRQRRRTSHRGHKKSGNSMNWIQTAHVNKGSYTRSVERRYGKEGFTQDGKIKQEVINKDKSSSDLRIKRKAVLADNLRRINK